MAYNLHGNKQHGLFTFIHNVMRLEMLNTVDPHSRVFCQIFPDKFNWPSAKLLSPVHNRTTLITNNFPPYTWNFFQLCCTPQRTMKVSSDYSRHNSFDLNSCTGTLSAFRYSTEVQILFLQTVTCFLQALYPAYYNITWICIQHMQYFYYQSCLIMGHWLRQKILTSHRRSRYNNITSYTIVRDRHLAKNCYNAIEQVHLTGGNNQAF